MATFPAIPSPALSLPLAAVFRTVGKLWRKFERSQENVAPQVAIHNNFQLHLRLTHTPPKTRVANT